MLPSAACSMTLIASSNWWLDRRPKIMPTTLNHNQSGIASGGVRKVSIISVLSWDNEYQQRSMNIPWLQLPNTRLYLSSKYSHILQIELIFFISSKFLILISQTKLFLLNLICQGCRRFETSVFFSVKINILTTGGFRVGFFQPDTNHP